MKRNKKGSLTWRGTCVRCRFFRRYMDYSDKESPGEMTGECRRYPPRILPRLLEELKDPTSGLVESITVYPVVCIGHWCGEFKSLNEGPQ